MPSRSFGCNREPHLTSVIDGEFTASRLSVTEQYDFLFPGYRWRCRLKLKGHILDMHMSPFPLEFRCSVGSQGEVCFLVVPKIKQHSFSQIRPGCEYLIDGLSLEAFRNRLDIPSVGYFLGCLVRGRLPTPLRNPPPFRHLSWGR